MATDISWNGVNRDLNFTSDGNLEINENCSTQNGSVLLEGRAFNIAQPLAGIGFNSQILGGPRSEAALQLNRWVSQVQADGGNATWQSLPSNGQDFNFNASVNYP